MPALPRWLPILLLALLATGCAGSRSSSERSPAPRRDILTREQLREAGYTNVFEAIQALRSNWLNTRGPDSFSSPGQVQVYQNNTRLGGIETLRWIGTAEINYVRYYDGIAASARWGLDHGNGVIFVSTEPR